MSLISLTFGENYLKNKRFQVHTEIVGPQAYYYDEDADSGVIEVQKVEKFIGTDEVCVIGTLTTGIIENQMLLEEDNARIVEIDSKHGSNTISKPGTKLLISISGITAEELSDKKFLRFKKEFKEIKKKKKGKLIIC